MIHDQFLGALGASLGPYLSKLATRIIEMSTIALALSALAAGTLPDESFPTHHLLFSAVPLVQLGASVHGDSCIAWRQTGGCSLDGPREPQNDKGCSDEISEHLSGFCECVDNRKEMEKGCEPGSFATCKDACALWPPPPQSPPLQPGEICTNECLFANDGECDHYSECDSYGEGGCEYTCKPGSDCNDCPPYLATPPPPQPPPLQPGEICTNECVFANDGECDHYSKCDSYGEGDCGYTCEPGSDCNDCPPYLATPPPPQPPPLQPGEICTNECVFANDGKCDHYSECDSYGEGDCVYPCKPGSDCNDCPPYTTIPLPPSLPSPPRPPPPEHCSDRCSTNGVCEDGAEGSSTSLCIFGTDCADCGVRYCAPPSPPTKVFLTSYATGKQLEDRDGKVGMHTDKGDWQKWTMHRTCEGR